MDKARPVNVLLVDHAPIVGGVEVMIRELLSALDPRRVAPTIVTDSHSPMRGQFGPGVPEVALALTRLKRNPLAGWTLLQSARQLARVARQTRAEVLQTFTARTHLTGALASLMARVPLVWRVNDDTLPPALSAVAGRVPRRVVSVSHHLQGKYRRALRITDIIPDGVPLSSPMPIGLARSILDLHLPADALVVALVGRLVRWKGHEVFLRAMAELAPVFPSLHGLIAGGWSAADNGAGLFSGGTAYRQELAKLAEELGVAGRVTFSGHTDRPATVFAAADVVAHTSIAPEPFGRVIIEAMAAARPVVAAAAGGPQEIVLDGITGMLTPPGDSRALAEALRTLLEDRSRREQMGLAGRSRVEAEYALPLMAERFTQLWTQVARPAEKR